MKFNLRKSVSVLVAAIMLVTSGVVISRSNTAEADSYVLQQTDPTWNSYPYGDGNLGNSGCGALAIINAVRYLTGNTMDIYEVADWGSANEYIWGVGSSFSIAPDAASKFGSTYGFQLDVHYGYNSYVGDSYPGSEEAFRSAWNTLVTKLSAGEVAVGLVHNHFIAIVDYDSATDRVLVYDPGAGSKRQTTTSGDWKTYNELDYWSSEGSSYLKLRGYLTYYFKTGATAATESTTTADTFSGTTDVAGTYSVNTDGSALNLRTLASTSGDVIAQIPSGASVTVLEADGTWAHVTYDGISGYCSLSYLTKTAETTTTTTGTTTTATTTTTAATTEAFSKQDAGAYVVSASGSYLNLRADADASADVVTVIPDGSAVTVTAANSDWAAVTWDGYTGYCNRQYLEAASAVTTTTTAAETTTTTTTTTAVTTTAETTQAQTETSTEADTTAATTEETTQTEAQTDSVAEAGAYRVDADGVHLNLRASGDTDADILAQIPDESEVFVISADDTWANVSWNGIVGYCKTEYLTQVIIEAEQSTDTITSIDDAFVTLYGDVNLDGSITMNDVVLLHKALAGSISLNKTAAANADCYADGALSTVDATVIIQSILGNCNLPVQPVQ
jgi:uncharacterized protein YgiM (DUF1202 family)